MAKLTLQSTRQLQSGHGIPVLGYGVSYPANTDEFQKQSWHCMNIGLYDVRLNQCFLLNLLTNDSPSSETAKVTLEALKAGFRHVRSPGRSQEDRTKEIPGRFGDHVPQRGALRKGNSEFETGSIAGLLHDQDPAAINGLRVYQASHWFEPKRSSTGLLWPVSLHDNPETDIPHGIGIYSLTGAYTVF